MDFMETASQNTYIFDPESAVELARLINQERVVTEAMGGALSGVPEPASLNNILDLACGAGGWGLDVAFVLPEAEVEGVDVSRKMVDYANTRARTQLLSNVSFGVMDITRTFEVPDQYCFPFSNGRSISTSWCLRTRWIIRVRLRRGRIPTTILILLVYRCSRCC